jgi:hypothetical protein
MFRHRRVSVNVKLNQIINFFADADGPIFRDGRRLTRAKGLTLTCSKNETVTPLVVTSTLVMFMVGSNVKISNS